MVNYGVITIIMLLLVIGGLAYTVYNQQQQIDQLKFDLWRKGDTIDYYFTHSFLLESTMKDFCTCNETVMKDIGLMK